MNEPAAFCPTKSLPLAAHFRADAALGGPGSHARLHNAYGMLMARATAEAMAAARPHARPFLLTRSGCLGAHRYAATWTGDCNSSWAHLHDSIAMLLNLSLSGQYLCGADIGGFVGNASAALFRRWMGIGALTPFARGHTTQDTRSHEPWAFDEATTALCRVALQRRYRLLPYLYGLARDAAQAGAPIMRPVFCLAPASAELRSVDDCFMLGAALLVLCDTTPSEPVPPGERVPISTTAAFRARLVGGAFTGGVAAPVLPLVAGEEVLASELPAVHLVPGAIVVLGREALQSTSDRTPRDALTFALCLDAAASARGCYYNDSGDGPVGGAGSTALSLQASCTGSVCVVSWSGVRSEAVDPFSRPVRVLVLRAGAAALAVESYLGAGAVFVRLV